MNQKWLNMLAGYGSHHQNATNAVMHIIGVPFIMLGVLIPLTWLGIDLWGVNFNAALLVYLALGAFYFSLDKACAVFFLFYAGAVLYIANVVGGQASSSQAWGISAGAFFGGYILQFIGHGIEGKAPALLTYPIQSQVAAPLFIVVELFKFMGIKEDMFNAMQARIKEWEQAKQA